MTHYETWQTVSLGWVWVGSFRLWAKKGNFKQVEMGQVNRVASRVGPYFSH